MKPPRKSDLWFINKECPILSDSDHVSQLVIGLDLLGSRLNSFMELVPWSHCTNGLWFHNERVIFAQTRMIWSGHKFAHLQKCDRHRSLYLLAKPTDIFVRFRWKAHKPFCEMGPWSSWFCIHICFAMLNEHFNTFEHMFSIKGVNNSSVVKVSYSLAQ